VHLRADPARPIEHMKREIGPLLSSTGFRVEWRDADEVQSTGALAVVELRGTCGLPAGNLLVDSADPKELASTFLSEDTVLPFITVNCGAVTRLLGPALVTEAGARRDYLYGRALARVLAHELYHVLANTREHAHDGIAKANVTVSDLLGERFEFAPGSKVKLENSTSTFSAVAGGR